jgi:hypothetical protein
MATTLSQLTELDFDGIKANLITYLQGQSVFSDYSFTGSGLTQLLNILSYNTSLNAYLANASMNEAFLDSAVKRGSAISRAKENGYTPRSASASQAIVNINIPSPISAVGMLTLPQYTPFTSNGYTFYNTSSVSVPVVNGGYTFYNVELSEGNLVSNSFLVTDNTNVSNLAFTIPNSGVDTTTIQVRVQNSATDTTTTPWTYTEDITNVTGTTKVYYIKCNASELYEIQFGDNVLGASPNIGNIIIVTYLVTNADLANVSANYPQVFTCNGIAGNTGLVINTVQNSIGGMPEETIDEIKFTAPLVSQSNNRAVTEEDYYGIITRYAPSVQSVNVFGGEKLTPPVYGKVYISLDPVTGYYIPASLKAQISDIVVKSRNMVTVIPEFIDPDYTFLTLNTNVEYDQNLTSLGASDIEAEVQTSINTYVTNNLGKFRQPFYFSQLSKAIDGSDASIQGNILSFNVQKRYDIAYGQPAYVVCNFGLPVKPNSLYSNCFTYYQNNTLVTAILIDDGIGNIQIWDYNAHSTILKVIGSIDYTTGSIKVNGLSINGITGNESQLKLSATPVLEVSNVLPNNNQIVKVDDSSASISDNVVSGISVNATPVVIFGTM